MLQSAGVLRALVLTSLIAAGPISVARRVVGQEQPKVMVDKNGIAHISACEVPLSSYMSDEAKKAFLDRIFNPVVVEAGAGTAKFRGAWDQYFYAPRLERAKMLYPVNIHEKKLGGVRTDVVTPKERVAVRNRDRVLINLHGGGFQGGAGMGGLVESVPIAGVGKIRVISVDYRESPEYKFPAASEDVAAVYKELLKQYKPENIGIYGCSAGGMPPSPNPPPWRWPMPYLTNADLKDPLVSPVDSVAVLAKFPPTLLITGTRSMELSAAAYTHTQLIKAGVEADLHVWDGMEHGFVYDVDLPESKDAFDVIAKFFDRHLGRVHK